jgi:thiol-disulfide isomerase/thioredoxin
MHRSVPPRPFSALRAGPLRPLRLLLVLALAIVGASLVVSPARAGGNTEIGTRVKVQGAKLPTSDDIGTPDDPAIGKTAPTLKGRSLTGEKVTFESTGKPRIMIFLSHSCPHCQAEVPVIVDLAKDGKLDGVEVQTVTTNTSEDLPNYPPSEWLEGEDWPFEPVLADDAKLRALLGMGGESFPYFVLIDADGKVVARASGELPAKTIATAAKHLAAGEPIFTS